MNKKYELPIPPSLFPINKYIFKKAHRNEHLLSPILGALYKKCRGFHDVDHKGLNELLREILRVPLRVPQVRPNFLSRIHNRRDGKRGRRHLQRPVPVPGKGHKKINDHIRRCNRP